MKKIKSNANCVPRIGSSADAHSCVCVCVVRVIFLMRCISWSRMCNVRRKSNNQKIMRDNLNTRRDDKEENIVYSSMAHAGVCVCVLGDFSLYISSLFCRLLTHTRMSPMTSSTRDDSGASNAKDISEHHLAIRGTISNASKCEWRVNALSCGSHGRMFSAGWRYTPLPFFCFHMFLIVQWTIPVSCDHNRRPATISLHFSGNWFWKRCGRAVNQKPTEYEMLISTR